MKNKFLAVTLCTALFTTQVTNIFASTINQSNDNLQINIEENKNYHSAQISFEVENTIKNLNPTYSGTEIFYKNTLVSSNNNNTNEINTIIDNNSYINGVNISYDIPKSQVKSPIKIKYLYTDNNGKINSDIKTISITGQNNNNSENNSQNNNNSSSSSGNASSSSSNKGAVISSSDNTKTEDLSSNNKTNNTNNNVNVQTYTDIDNHWAKPFITDLVEKNIIKGYPDGTFKPNNKIIRGDFFLLVNNMINEKAQQTKNINFNDLGETYYSDAIKNLSDLNIISGYEDNTIKPNNLITREEVSIVLNKILEHFNKTVENNNNVQFNDDKDISSWAYESVKKLSSMGVISGYTDNTIKPKNDITRGEVAKVIHTIINLI